MDERKRTSNRRIFLTILALTVIAAIVLVIWAQTPKPLLLPEAEPEFLEELTIVRWGEYAQYGLDSETAQAVLACLERYTWVPRLRYYSPRLMSEIPFELRLDFYDEGPKHIVLGKDYFWYRSASQHIAIYYDIINGEALLEEILEMTGIQR